MKTSAQTVALIQQRQYDRQARFIDGPCRSTDRGSTRSAPHPARAMRARQLFFQPIPIQVRSIFTGRRPAHSGFERVHAGYRPVSMASLWSAGYSGFQLYSKSDNAGSGLPKTTRKVAYRSPAGYFPCAGTPRLRSRSSVHAYAGAGLAPVAENGFENIMQVLRLPAGLLRACGAVIAFGPAIGLVTLGGIRHALLSCRIKLGAAERCAFTRIGQQLVGCRNGLETLLCLRNAWIQIGMMLFASLRGLCAHLADLRYLQCRGSNRDSPYLLAARHRPRLIWPCAAPGLPIMPLRASAALIGNPSAAASVSLDDPSIVRVKPPANIVSTDNSAPPGATGVSGLTDTV